MRNSYKRFIKMNEVESRNLEWLWNPYIAKGSLTLIHGQRGIGKTLFAIRLMSAFSGSLPLPYSSDANEPCRILYLTDESDLSATLKDRFETMKVDMSRVYVGNDALPFTLADDSVEDFCVEHDIKVLIVDPVAEYLEMDKDIRPILNKLYEFARRTGCAVILVSDSDGPGGEDEYHWVYEYGNYIDNFLCLTLSDDESDPCMDMIHLLIHEKSRLSIEGDDCEFYFDGDGLVFETEYQYIGDHFRGIDFRKERSAAYCR